MLGVFMLPVFTRLEHECQDLSSLCDGLHVCTDWTSVCSCDAMHVHRLDLGLFVRCNACAQTGPRFVRAM